MTDSIHQVSPLASYLELQTQIDEAVLGVLSGGRYILGSEVSAFEQELAASISSGRGVGVGNGTDALQLALMALGIGAGDVVITVSHTAVATVAAIELAGASPLLVDVDPVSYTLDTALLEETICQYSGSGRLKAVLVVHLYGCPADMDAVMSVARQHELYVIEDCAQAQGAQFRGAPVGSFGDVATFSFYPTKNLGALGDGGALVIQAEEVFQRALELRQYGWRSRFISEEPGMNTRLDELQAAILRVKFKHLASHNQRRRAIAALYDRELAQCDFVLPAVPPGIEHVYHQYVIASGQRESLRAALEQASIGTAIHYPMPVHVQPAYRRRVALGVGGMKNTEALSAQILSLPMYPQLSDTEVLRVCDVILSTSVACAR